MRRLIINLFVALLTFAIGVVASALLYSVTPSTENAKKQVFAVETRTVLQTKSETLSTPCSCHQDSMTGELGATASVANEPKAPISAGVLNGKASNLPQPQYPSIAKAAHASGTVIVQVLIDERGCVQSARAISGHPLLQAASVQAAYQACFTPTRLSGHPIKVSGVVTYNFVLS